MHTHALRTETTADPLGLMCTPMHLEQTLSKPHAKLRELRISKEQSDNVGVYISNKLRVFHVKSNVIPNLVPS